MLLNKIVNWIKVGIAILADTLDSLYNPFEPFTRPAEPKYPEPLWAKAQKFENDMGAFLWPERCIYLYTLPPNSGDQALWHGVYTAMYALKYSVTGFREDLDFLHGCIPGLFQHQHVPGEAQPRLIRGWRPDGTFEDEASNDQLSGHLLGIYFLWKDGDQVCRSTAAELIRGIADELVIRDNKLVNADGSVTRHGKLENGYLTEPMGLSLCLVTYLMAFRITSDTLYKERYDALVSKYYPIIPYAKMRLWSWEHDYDTHRAAIHYSILCDLENEHDVHRKYLAGLLRTWRLAKKSANPWIYFLVRRVCLVDPETLDAVRTHLIEFTLEDKQYATERINSGTVETLKWGGHLRVRQPLPRWKVGSQDFFWQRNLYSADDWIGYEPGGLRHNGGDFLVAYWGLRSLRLVSEDE